MNITTTTTQVVNIDAHTSWGGCCMASDEAAAKSKADALIVGMQ